MNPEDALCGIGLTAVPVFIRTSVWKENRLYVS